MNRDIEASTTSNKTARMRVLIVSSSYSPTMIADMHRARHLAWHLPENGWDVEILSPNSGYQQGFCLDSDSESFFCPDTKVHLVPTFMRWFFQMIGGHSIGLRAFIPLWWRGRRLLKSRRFDLVYFSTTQFILFLLGAIWRLEFSVPYVLDIHDPIHLEPKKYRAWLRRGFKHAVSRWVARQVEARSIMAASGLVSVSPMYLEDFCERYGQRKPAWQNNGRSEVIPFAVFPRDLDIAIGRTRPGTGVLDSLRIVYVGAGGPIMRRGFTLFCRAMAELRKIGSPLADRRLAIELYGTKRGWHEGQCKELAETAIEHGIGDLVDERPVWLSYRRSLELLQSADGVLILGVDDAGYMPSKLFTYAYSGKPLLALLRKEGPAYATLAQDTKLGHVIWFSEFDDMCLTEAVTVLRQFLIEVTERKTIDRSDRLAAFFASTMAARHAKLFASICASNL